MLTLPAFPPNLIPSYRSSCSPPPAHPAPHAGGPPPKDGPGGPPPHGEEPPKPQGWGFSLFGTTPAPAPAPEAPKEHAPPKADEPKPEGDILGSISAPFVSAGEGIAYGAEQSGKGVYVGGEYAVGGTVTAAQAIGSFFTETIPSLVIVPAPKEGGPPGPEGHPHPHPPKDGPDAHVPPHKDGPPPHK